MGIARHLPCEQQLKKKAKQGFEENRRYRRRQTEQKAAKS